MTTRMHASLLDAACLATAFLAALGAGPLPGALSAPAAWAMEAGAAKVEITPPLGTPLTGDARRLGRGALEVHDPLWARCLFLDDGETALFLVAADLCVINPDLRERVAALAQAEFGIDAGDEFEAAVLDHTLQVLSLSVVRLLKEWAVHGAMDGVADG